MRAARSRGRPAGARPRLLPDEEKARRADFVYVNDGSLEELDAFVAGVIGRAHGRDVRKLLVLLVVVAAAVVAVFA